MSALFSYAFFSNNINISQSLLQELFYFFVLFTENYLFNGILGHSHIFNDKMNVMGICSTTNLSCSSVFIIFFFCSYSSVLYYFFPQIKIKIVLIKLIHQSTIFFLWIALGQCSRENLLISLLASYANPHFWLLKVNKTLPLVS